MSEITDLRAIRKKQLEQIKGGVCVKVYALTEDEIEQYTRRNRTRRKSTLKEIGDRWYELESGSDDDEEIITLISDEEEAPPGPSNQGSSTPPTPLNETNEGEQLCLRISRVVGGVIVLNNLNPQNASSSPKKEIDLTDSNASTPDGLSESNSRSDEVSSENHPAVCPIPNDKLVSSSTSTPAVQNSTKNASSENNLKVDLPHSKVPKEAKLIIENVRAVEKSNEKTQRSESATAAALTEIEMANAVDSNAVPVNSTENISKSAGINKEVGEVSLFNSSEVNSTSTAERASTAKPAPKETAISIERIPPAPNQNSLRNDHTTVNDAINETILSMFSSKCTSDVTLEKISPNLNLRRNQPSNLSTNLSLPSLDSDVISTQGRNEITTPDVIPTPYVPKTPTIRVVPGAKLGIVENEFNFLKTALDTNPKINATVDLVTSKIIDQDKELTTNTAKIATFVKTHYFSSKERDQRNRKISKQMHPDPTIQAIETETNNYFFNEGTNLTSHRLTELLLECMEYVNPKSLLFQIHSSFQTIMQEQKLTRPYIFTILKENLSFLLYNTDSSLKNELLTKISHQQYYNIMAEIYETIEGTGPKSRKRNFSSITSVPQLNATAATMLPNKNPRAETPMYPCNLSINQYQNRPGAPNIPARSSNSCPNPQDFSQLRFPVNNSSGLATNMARTPMPTCTNANAMGDLIANRFADSSLARTRLPTYSHTNAMGNMTANRFDSSLVTTSLPTCPNTTNMENCIANSFNLSLPRTSLPTYPNANAIENLIANRLTDSSSIAMPTYTGSVLHQARAPNLSASVNRPNNNALVGAIRTEMKPSLNPAMAQCQWSGSNPPPYSHIPHRAISETNIHPSTIPVRLSSTGPRQSISSSSGPPHIRQNSTTRMPARKDDFGMFSIPPTSTCQSHCVYPSAPNRRQYVPTSTCSSAPLHYNPSMTSQMCTSQYCQPVPTNMNSMHQNHPRVMPSYMHRNDCQISGRYFSTTDQAHSMINNSIMNSSAGVNVRPSMPPPGILHQGNRVEHSQYISDSSQNSAFGFQRQTFQLRESSVSTYPLVCSDKPLSVPVINSSLSPNAGPSPNNISTEMPISVPIVQSSSSPKNMDQICDIENVPNTNQLLKDAVVDEFLNVDELNHIMEKDDQDGNRK